METLRGWAAALPPLDFYVPLAVHRRGWKGTAEFVVGLNLDVDDTRLAGYRADGSVVRLDRRDGIPSVAVILLHPAEPKSVRPGGGRRSGGETIEDGTSLLQSTCDPTSVEPCTGDDDGGGSSTGYTGGELYAFKNHLPDGWGGIELMVKHYTGMGGTKLDEDVLSEGGLCVTLINCYPDWSYPTEPMVMGTYGTYIKVWERDSGAEAGADDFWGEMSFKGYGGANVHQFWVQCSSVGPDDTYCDPSWPGWEFNTRPTVDIIYMHMTNGTYDS